MTPAPARVNRRSVVMDGVCVAEKIVVLAPVYRSVPPLKTRLAAVAPVPIGLAAPAFIVVVPAGNAKATVPAPRVRVLKVDAALVSESVPPPPFERLTVPAPSLMAPVK